jgi:bifunctional non-homologous end joining protein LigD
MSLREYVRKRDFRITAEPRGEEKTDQAKRRFVIQKHDASRLHYDFRLELDGVLKSWAVPKGVPYVKGEKRLAMQVEDHPLDYADFEGIIPAGQYGGGTVMVWDTGSYENLGGDAQTEIANGKLHFALEGSKLKGEWTLVRMKRGEGNEWLLIKSSDDLKPISKRLDDRSCLSGRTMAQIAKGKTAQPPANGSLRKVS